jgi:hypothetical protein
VAANHAIRIWVQGSWYAVGFGMRIRRSGDSWDDEPRDVDERRDYGGRVIEGSVAPTTASR